MKAWYWQEKESLYIVIVANLIYIFMLFTMGSSKFNTSLSVVCFFGLLVAPIALFSQTSIPAFLEPDSSGPQIATIEQGSLSWDNARPLLDRTMAMQRWHWTEHRDSYTGFVEIRALNKQMEVRPNTLVRVQPEEGAAILTLLSASDSVELVDVGDNWAQIRFSRVLPVYFQIPENGDDVAVAVPEGLSQAPLPQVEEPQVQETAEVETTVPVVSVEPLQPEVEEADLLEVAESEDRPQGFDAVPVASPEAVATAIDARLSDEVPDTSTETDVLEIADADQFSVDEEEERLSVIRQGTRRTLQPVSRDTSPAPALEDDLFFVDESVRTLDPLDAERELRIVPEEDLPPIPTPQELAMQFAPATTVVTTYEGILKRTSRRNFRGPETEFVLVGQTGRILAFLDTSEVIIPNLEALLGTRVGVNGSLQEVRRGQRATIKVRSISPRR